MHELSLKSARRAVAVALALGALSGCAGAPSLGLMSGEAASREGMQFQRLGEAALESRDFIGAARLFGRAARNGVGAEAEIGLGESYLALGEPQNAIDAFERALEDEPRNADANRGLGRAYIALSRPHLAFEPLEAAIAAAPGDPRGYNALGVAHDLLGRHRDALAAYEKGLDIDRSNVSLQNNLGLSLALAGDTERATKLLGLLARSPNATQQHRQNLALAHALAGDLERAAQIARMDLDESSVQQNLAYYQALASMEGDRRKRLALAAGSRTAASAPADPAQAAAKARALANLELAGSNVAFAPQTAGRWFVNLGRSSSQRGAEAAWRRLQQGQPELFSTLNRLRGVQEGIQPILAGPLGGRRQAEELCAEARAAGIECEPRRI